MSENDGRESFDEGEDAEDHSEDDHEQRSVRWEVAGVEESSEVEPERDV